MVTFLNEECRWNLKKQTKIATLEPRLNLLTSQWNRLEPTSEVDSITEVFHIYELCPPPVRDQVEFLDASLSGYNLSRTS